MNVYEILILVGLPSILTFLFTLLFNFIFKKISNKKGDEILLRKGLQALLRDRLLEKGTDHVKKGFITISNKDNYDNMYRTYHSLGKNGVMDTLYSEVMTLPNEKPKHKEGK